MSRWFAQLRVAFVLSSGGNAWNRNSTKKSDTTWNARSTKG